MWDRERWSNCEGFSKYPYRGVTCWVPENTRVSIVFALLAAADKFLTVCFMILQVTMRRTGLVTIRRSLTCAQTVRFFCCDQTCYLDRKVLFKVLELLCRGSDGSKEQNVGLLDIIVRNIPSVGSHLCLEPVHCWEG